MTQFIIFLIIGVVGIVVGYYLAVRRKTRGLNAHIMRQREEKEKRKQRILEMLERKEEIANNDVEQALGISDSTATNYLQELEDEGKIRQVGPSGRFVRYKLNG